MNETANASKQLLPMSGLRLANPAPARAMSVVPQSSAPGRSGSTTKQIEASPMDLIRLHAMALDLEAKGMRGLANAYRKLVNEHFWRMA